MTILPFCALFPLLHTTSLQTSEHSHTLCAELFKVLLIFFPHLSCCGSTTCTFRQDTSDCCIYVRKFKFTELNTHLTLTPLILLFALIYQSCLHLFACTKLFLRLPTSLPQLKGSLSNQLCNEPEDTKPLWYHSFNFLLTFHIIVFNGYKNRTGQK